MPILEVELEALEDGRILKHRLFTGDHPVSYRLFIDKLSGDKTFRQEFNELLASSEFKAFRFETPVLTSITNDKPFEFVLIDAPGLCHRNTDPHTFAQYFSRVEPIVEFKSLGADATLIVPSPKTSFASDQDCYLHLASFVRSAPPEQIDALWEIVGQVLQNNTGPIWLNTEGSGVAWLHIRLDTRPKYYGYTPYKTVERSGDPNSEEPTPTL